MEMAAVPQHVEQMAVVAQQVADITKFMAGLSSALQLVVPIARFTVMFAEANRGTSILPGTLRKTVVFLSYVLESAVQILDPDAKVEEML